MLKNTDKNFRRVKSALFAQGVIALAIKILAAASVLVLNAVITRVLSLQDVAGYLTFNAFVLFWVMASANGIPAILMRWIAYQKARCNHHGMERNILKSVLLLLLTGGVSAYYFLQLFYEKYFHLVFAENLIMLAVAWICLALVLRVLGEVFRGLGETAMANLVTAINSHGIMVTLIVAGVLAVLGLEHSVDMVVVVKTYVIVLALVVSGVGCMLVAVIRRERNGNSLAEPTVENGLAIAQMLQGGMMLAITELSVYVITQGDIWIVGHYAPGTEVARYGVAAKVAGLTSLVLIAGNSVLPARMAVYIREGKKQGLENEIRRFALLALVMAAAWVLVCQLVGGQLLGILFGREYRSAKYILVILSLGQLVNVATGSCALLLVMYRKERELLCGTLLVLALYLACVFPAGRMYGAMGVACCSAIAYALMNVVYVVLAKWATGINSSVINF